jgi:hypothetical protein
MRNLETSDVECKGYHGTSSDVAEEIKRTYFKLSAPDSGAYLGEGVYFFDGQLSQAKRWAITRYSKVGKGIAVIESRIRHGRILNLTDREHRDLVLWFEAEFNRKSLKKATLPTIIDIVAEKLQIDVIKAVRIPSNASLIMETSFSSDVEVILAVRNLTNILSKAIVWSQLT